MHTPNRSTLWTRSALSLAVTAAALGFSQGSLAQQIEEIMVTAQKRAESLQDVSASVSAMDTGLMQDAGINDMSDVSYLAPALTVTTNNGPWASSFRMRRIGNEGNIPTFEPDTGLFIDGAFRSRSGTGLSDLVDIERIEVVKGPQSTLYGKNVTAGLVSISTLAPSQEFDAMGELSAGSFGEMIGRGYINGGLSDTVSGRLSISSTQRDHWVENLGTGGDADNQQSYALRGQLLIEPTDDLSVRLIAGAVNRDFDSALGDVTFGNRVQSLLGTSQLLFGSSVSNTTALQDNVATNRLVDRNGNTQFTQDSKEFTAIADYAMGDLTLTSISSYDDYDVATNQHDADQSQLRLASFNETTSGRSFSQELRLASAGGETVDWMTGLFYYDNNFTRGDGSDTDFLMLEDIDELGKTIAFAQLDPATQGMLLGLPEGARYGALPALLGQPGEYADFYNEQDTNTFGAFASATWNISDDFSLSGGLRYNREKKSALLESSNNGTGISVIGLGNPNNPFATPDNLGLVGKLAPNNHWEAEDTWSHVTYNLTAEYHWTDDFMTYLTGAHGFKAGGFNLGFGDAPNDERPFGEETVDTVELGWKSHLFDSRVQLNGALFHTVYNDFQSAAFQGLQFNVDNAEKVTNQGLEFDALIMLGERLSMNLAASYVDARYDEYTRGTCAFGVAAGANGFCDLSGETLPFAPKWKNSAGLQYEYPLAGGDLYTRLDVSYVGEHIPASSLDKRFTQEAYTLTNARLGWRNENWDISAWGKNLTDETYVGQYAPDNVMGALGADNSYQAFLGAPRTVGATLRYHF
ncbi:TonB-dependent receptor [Microbulbifer pacificus]|uniref:TonB-dependent receptor n=1 Tax=Microbulbifer pacificus TaxID=407164 RepID=UPI001319B926|nr:TonB-dependent receptor [Microbulbifer pacificus]